MTIEPYSLHSIVGSSPATTALRHQVARIAMDVHPTVLIAGESGTGKELVARVIHWYSAGADGEFVELTCSTVPERDVEIALAASRGTVFLDEVADMPLPLQERLLHALEDRSLERRGGKNNGAAAVRLIAATTRNLQDEVAGGRLDGNLFGRLVDLQVAIAPLRMRLEDVPLLVEHFVGRFNDELRKKILGATPAAYTALQRYSWPGNVRELRNAIERAMLLSVRDRLDAGDFALLTDGRGSVEAFELPPGGIDLEQLERSLVAQALRRSGGNQTRAAALLGLNRDQVRYRVEKFGLSLGPSFRQ